MTLKLLNEGAKGVRAPRQANPIISDLWFLYDQAMEEIGKAVGEEQLLSVLKSTAEMATNVRHAATKLIDSIISKA
ncbi:hypothetical protein AALO_G00254110 [Alosa alosa]|uniref:Uncharacterized protein n=1 Tax=Alosa alosa TaxID=278164 RepID=A0AAV6FTC5_9TELE|nr:hypothetical protein AALO_G00254110 [Alosa alosa]